MDPIAQTSAPDQENGGAPHASVLLPDGSRLSAPVDRTPDQLKIGQWIAVGGKPPLRIENLHRTQAGGRLVALHGRSAPLSLAPRDVVTVYTMQSLRGSVRRLDVA